MANCARILIPGYHVEQIGDHGGGHDRIAPFVAPRWLLLHGFTGLALDWAPCWPDAQAALAIDLPGHGRSPDPHGDFTAEIARLLAALPPGIDSLAGYSLGGRIALSLMAVAPARFQQLVILSAHPGQISPAERAARRAQDQAWIRCLQERGSHRFAAAWQRQALFQHQATRAPTGVRAQHRQRLAQRPEGLARSLACFGLGEMPPTWDALAAYRGELHWISGAEDGKFHAIGEQIKAMRTRTHRHIIADCGHNPLIEAPAQLSRILREVTARRSVHARLHGLSVKSLP